MRINLQTMQIKIFFWATVLSLLCHSAAFTQTKEVQKLPEKTRILFLVDGSGSMLDAWARPNQTKITVAKRIMTKLVDSLRHNDKLELALRIYGHRYPKEQNNCEDTRLEVPFKPKNHSLIINTLNEIKPKGVTPITYSLEQAAKDFPVGTGYRNILILITDGIESCGGDLCATSRELQKKGVFLRPYIIGLGTRAEKSLECAGRYIDASTPDEFYRILNQAIESTMAKTTVSIELLDSRQQPTETNVNVSFINTYTGMPMYDFVHQRNAQGKTDTIQVDPVIEYDLVVNTVPAVIRKHIMLDIGKHNVIKIPAPQGNITVQQEGRKDFQAVVRQAKHSEILHTQSGGETFRYLTGPYEVETLTLPRRIFEVEVEPNKTKTVYLPSPGVVNINTISTGYGSLYEIQNDGTQKWVCNLNDLKPRFSLTLLPGRYKVVFRVKHATGSKYTGFKYFSLKTGETVSVNVFD